MGDPESCYRCGRNGHWSKECPRIWNERGGFRERGNVFPPPPPPSFLLRDRMMENFRDFDYYDRHDDYDRDMFERRYPPMTMRARDFPPMGRDRMPPPPPMMGGRGPSMRSSFPDSREMFTRRSPPGRSSGMSRGSFGVYEDFSRDSFDERRPGPGGMRGVSPTHRYAPY